MTTSAGKSLCCIVPSLIFSSRLGSRTCLVISPFSAVMTTGQATTANSVVDWRSRGDDADQLLQQWRRQPFWVGGPADLNFRHVTMGIRSRDTIWSKPQATKISLIFDNANYGQKNSRNESRDTLAWDNVILARCRRDFYIARWMNLQSKRSSTRGLWPRPKVLEGPGPSMAPPWPLHGPSMAPHSDATDSRLSVEG